MNRYLSRHIAAGLAGLFLLASAASHVAAQTRVSIGVTETIETHNPYGDSVSLLYGIWSEIRSPGLIASRCLNGAR